ncbi:hypothetical protein P3T76_001969 [Phytophthora citrophthora]|uniref:Uncharacterized protein n=1 Tax=Phytophthora citrophthora TaxID=4793 RepID=A0AAD9LS05_9STRA|nr:hypothetical protein P3T76_001969 [Phytophthora citrophthora]
MSEIQMDLDAIENLSCSSNGDPGQSLEPSTPWVSMDMKGSRANTLPQIQPKLELRANTTPHLSKVSGKLAVWAVQDE